MLYSFKLLKKLAQLPKEVTVKDVSKAMLSLGFEVEKIEKFSNVNGIKFGKVEKLYQNPNADKLTVTEVIFNDKKRTIQTTASNLKEGDFVIAFVPGSRSGDVTFESKKLKGVVSEGMLSNISEFGVPKEYLREEWYKGIGTYPELPLETDPIDYLMLNDSIIEVDILTNRSDAASYIVMAKELAAYFGTKVKEIKSSPSKITSDVKVKDGFADNLTITEVKNNFTITPDEQVLLAKHKIKSINNGTDLSNLIRLYSGVPAHVYDKAQVGKSFEADIYSGKVKIFGEKEVELKDALAILADNKIVSVASVIGIDEVEVSHDSEELLYEMAIFPNKLIRKNMRQVKLDTPSGIQGGKVISSGMIENGYAYISQKAKVHSSPTNFKERKPEAINFNLEKLSMIIGEKAQKVANYKKVLSALKTLGYKIEGKKITPPSYRHDVHTQQDLNEEFMRLIGYDNIKGKEIELKRLKIQEISSNKEALYSNGYQEVMTYILTSEELNNINPFATKDSVKLLTSFSSEREVVRHSQIVSLIDVAQYNRKRGIKDISIFSEGSISNEKNTSALLTTEKSFKEVQQLIANLIPGAIFKRKEYVNIHPNISAEILLDNKVIGFIGKTHPKRTKVSAIIAEWIIGNYSRPVTFKEYNSEPLKYEDTNYELGSKEDLASKFSRDISAFSEKVIDEYHDKNLKRITVRTVKEKKLKLLEKK